MDQINKLIIGLWKINMSKMLDAIIAAKLKQQKFRVSIRDLILTDQAFLMNIRLSYGNLRLNREPWHTPNDDVAALDEYLATESSGALLDVYAELTTKFIIKKSTYFQTLKNFTASFNALRGYLYQIMIFMPKLQARLELKATLNKALQDSRYDDLFIKVAKTERGFYHKLLQKTYSDEQKFNTFLSYIKMIIGKKQIKDAHKLLQAAEKKLLGGLITSHEIGDHVEDRIKQNLRVAYALVYNFRSAIVTIPSFVDQKIKSAASLVGQLIIKMTRQKEKIQDPLMTKEEKRRIFLILQQNQIKLLHFIVKTDALSKGETLSLNQKLDLDYMLKQLDKLPYVHEVDQVVGNAKSRDGNKSTLRLFDMAFNDSVNVETSSIVLPKQQSNANLVQVKYQLSKAIP